MLSQRAQALWELPHTLKVVLGRRGVPEARFVEPLPPPPGGIAALVPPSNQPRSCRNRGRGRAHRARRYSLGPPARTSGEACDSYFLKFSRNSEATFLA